LIADLDKEAGKIVFTFRKKVTEDESAKIEE
jgi:hypothetical protein